MPSLKENHLIQKRNILNEIRYPDNYMTLQELRFFSIYLSKINAKDVNTRVVRFPLDDFKAIMELGRIDIGHMKEVTRRLLRQVVESPLEKPGYNQFQLFKECTVSQDESGDWYVEIDASDKALPLMFEFKNRYFTYQLWNALRLKSSNQIRMYEILKQYQTVGYRILTVQDLKALLGIEEKEYSRYGDFNNRVLKACQQALAEHTDINFTYEPHGKRGKGGKILSIKFTIEKNENYRDQLTLNMFIDEQKSTDDMIDLNDLNSDDASELLEAGLITKKEDKLIFLREAVNNEFTIEQMAVLYDIVISDMPELLSGDKWKECYHHFMSKYNYLKEKESSGEIKNPFGYLKSIISKP